MHETRSKVISFQDGNAKLVGFAANSIQAAKLIGCESTKLERVKHEGMAWVNPADDAARAQWNRPIATPQVAW